MSRLLDTSAPHEAVSAFTRDSDTISVRSRHTLRAFGDDSDADDPWSAIPPSSSTSSVSDLTRLQRRRLLGRALVQLVVLFVVCLVGLGGTLWLALPVIAPEDKASFKIPRSFDDLKALNAVLQHYKTDHFARVLLCWVVVYMFLQAFSIPGSMYMSILAGALFGVPLALPLVCVSVATGATICYYISKTLGVVLVALPSWKKRVDEWKEKLAEHSDGMVSYLIVVRMMPLPPHNIVNIMAPHLGIGVGTFWLSTCGGIFAVSVIHTTIGEKLDQMTSPDDFHLFSWRNMLLLVGVAAAVLLPVLIKKTQQPLEGEPSRGQVYLGGDDDQEARLPDSFRRNLVGASDSDDELPRRTLDTGGIQEDEAWRDAAMLDDDDVDADVIGRSGFQDRGAHPAPHQQQPASKLKKWMSASGLKL
ncbi:uncharacterized protein PSANT_06088 [Moesziomyces antarcticus]|nr:uncharacterized protein PSANT_06088 [Moesziomyces antarcticus]